MKHYIDIEPLSFNSKDAVEENDTFYPPSSNTAQDPLIDDLLRNNLLHPSEKCFDQNKINKEDMNDFLKPKDDNNEDKTNNIKQNERLLSSDKYNTSNSLTKEKSKRVRKPHRLRSLINKINQIQLTKHDIIMIILNICMILILIIVYQVLSRLSRDEMVDAEEVLLMKRGEPFGGPGGEELMDDAEIAALNFNDTITSVAAVLSYDFADVPMLLSLTFRYSNDKKGKEYGGVGRRQRWEDLNTLELASDEYIEQITVYAGHRNITNPWREDKLTGAQLSTYIIVGIYFETNRDQKIMYGSRNGTKSKESPKNYFLAYVQGRAVGHIDSLRFTWYKYSLKNSTIIEANDP